MYIFQNYRNLFKKSTTRSNNINTFGDVASLSFDKELLLDQFFSQNGKLGHFPRLAF